MAGMQEQAAKQFADGLMGIEYRPFLQKAIRSNRLMDFFRFSVKRNFNNHKNVSLSSKTLRLRNANE